MNHSATGVLIATLLVGPVSCLRDIPELLPPLEGAFVTGRVVERSPISGELEPRAGVRIGVAEWAQAAVSAADGRFILRRLGLGRATLIFERKNPSGVVESGYFLSVDLPADGQSLDLGDIAIAQDATLSGTLYFEPAPGEPPAPAIGGVAAIPGTSYQALNSDQGFVFPNLPPGVFDLVAVYPGFDPVHIEEVEAASAAETSLPDVVFTQTATTEPVRVEGEVLMEHGGPVDGVRIHFQSLVDRSAPGEETSTDPSGHYQVQVLPGLYRVRFVRSGALTVDVPVLAILPGERFRVQTVVLAQSPPNDLDGDGRTDDEDADLDNDGCPNPVDIRPQDPLVCSDTDQDGIPDAQDRDDDNDGLSDVEERSPGLDGVVTHPWNPDTDRDGLSDAEDLCPLEPGETCEPAVDLILTEARPRRVERGAFLEIFGQGIAAPSRTVVTFTSPEGASTAVRQTPESSEPGALRVRVPFEAQPGPVVVQSGPREARLPGDIEVFSRPTVLTVAQEAGHTEWVRLLTEAGLSDLLSGTLSFTLLAPTNEALRAAEAQIPNHVDTLQNVLRHHVLVGTYSRTELLNRARVETLAGTELEIQGAAETIENQPLRTGEASNRVAENGIVHALNGLMVLPNLRQSIDENDSLATFRGALASASPSIRALFEGPGPITVFAPIDGSENAGELSRVSGPDLDHLIRYHLVDSQVLSGQLEHDARLPMHAGLSTTVRHSHGSIRLRDGQRRGADLVAINERLQNGMLHLVDRVLVPNDLIAQARANGLTALVELAATAGLLETFRSDDGPYTVFSPTNAAFDAAFDLGLEAITPEAAANILLHHIVLGRIETSTLAARPELTSLLGTRLPVGALGTPQTIAEARLSTPVDIEASNGLLHSLAQVIYRDAVRDVIADPTRELSRLDAILLTRASPATRAAISPNLYTGGTPVTVFAPNDGAFAEVDLASFDSDRVLPSHVVEGELSREELTGSITTINNIVLEFQNAGWNIDVRRAGGVGSRIVEGPIQTLNGVVYIVDRLITN